MQTKKVVINKCFGGFSLSAKAVARLAELQGRECYFFHQPWLGSNKGRGPLTAITVAEADESHLFSAFDIPDPRPLMDDSGWHTMTQEERQAHNAAYKQHALDNRPDKRDDPLLVQVVEELGPEANGRHAELKVVEIPADVDYEIDEYDGMETIREAHRSWG